MVQLTFYGGINEIGGNKILLEEGERRLLLDFGFPYKQHRLFYEEYLKPRSGAGLLDPLAMGLLPPIEGLYRRDLVTPGLWPQFRDSPGYREIEQVDGVLLTHAHLDHSGHISFLRGDISIYTTAVTAFMVKAMQDSGKSDFEQQVCYFNPMVYECPHGWQQVACLSGDAPKQQRQFCLADIEPEKMTPEAHQFWNRGFWEKTPRQKEFVSSPLSSHRGCTFNLRCLPVDHSVPGACAWGIETASGWIVYSGDLRQHGKRGELTQRFVAEARRLQPRVLILEGTNVERGTNVTEREVYEKGLKSIAGASGLVIADFSARDVDRLLTFLQIARDTGRKLVILPKDAYLLKTMRLLEPATPDIAGEDSLVIYQDTVAGKYPALWLRNLCQEYSSKIVLAGDISSAQDKFILCFSFFDLNELPSIKPGAGSLYVYSSSEPHSEEQEIDFRRLHQWLQRFGLRGVGLPVERNGQWQVPEDERGLHASGHACGTDLLAIASEINPRILIPVHSEHPGFYLEHLSGSGTKVILPAWGQTIEV
ncbi:MAG: RNA-metabolising metallo-beta-lactamase [Dehalococcoidales bacterium]|nr:RNA-metabolising metallo-beta-lactamase [Dehalococcoidales bacterium]